MTLADGIHSMELKGRLLFDVDDLARLVGNPFNGIESVQPREEPLIAYPPQNPFNGIESQKLHLTFHPEYRNPFNGIESPRA